MSNIYIQEPPTSGKVLLKTSVGDIDIELWTRECPRTCRNFIQLCMDGYYNGTIFHRAVKGFIVQGGDPDGDGSGGESAFGFPFKDEFHSRLRYTRRGLVGMANSGMDDNGSQFFFTMAPTPELQNKNTLFGKVTGDTLFNMLKLEEGLVDHNDRPMYPQKIIRTEILNNPFDDIIPREIERHKKKDKVKPKKEKGVKNYGLLSFGSEAEEDEEETNKFVQNNVGKPKSMHDVVDDPKWSKKAIRVEHREQPSNAELQNNSEAVFPEQNEDGEDRLKKIKDKLKINRDSGKTLIRERSPVNQEDSESDGDVLITEHQEQLTKNEKRKEEIRQEIIALKKQYQSNKKLKSEMLTKKIEKESSDVVTKMAVENEFVKNFLEEKEKYSSLKKKLPKKGADREMFTLNLLSKFRSKLDTLRNGESEASCNTESLEDKEVEKDIQGDQWLAHKLTFEDKQVVLAKDASTKDDDWYDAYDPRNPLNKRKRGEQKDGSKVLHSKRSK